MEGDGGKGTSNSGSDCAYSKGVDIDSGDDFSMDLPKGGVVRSIRAQESDHQESDAVEQEVTLYNILIETSYTRSCQLCLQVQAGDTVKIVKRLIHAMEGFPPEQQLLTFGGRLLDDGRRLGDYKISKDMTLHLKLSESAMCGGAGSKRKRGEMANPFDDEEARYSTMADAPIWQEAFNHAVAVGPMTKDQLDVTAMLAASTAAQLDAVILHLTSGKAHHNIKLDDVCEMIPFVISMKQVTQATELSMMKFKKMMSAKLWALGCAEVNSVFKMDTLVAFVRGVRSLK